MPHPRAITDQELDVNENGTLILKNKRVPVQLVQPNPYLNYDPYHDTSMFNIVDRDYGMRLRVSENNGLYLKQYQFLLVMFGVSADIKHPVQDLIRDLDKSISEAIEGIVHTKRATISYARCDVDKYPLVRRMLDRAFGDDAKLLPLLVLFEDTVARRPPVFRPLSKTIGDIPDHRNIENYINRIIDAKIS